MKGLTDKQRNILAFIEDFMSRNTMAPTVYEIADNFKIKTSTVFAHLRALQKKKFLTRSSKARSLSITKPQRKARRGSSMLPVPLLGKMAAASCQEGFHHEKEGEVLCDPALLGGDVDPKKLFAIKIQGHSMEMGIVDGDIVVAKHAERASSGDIVVAMIGGETFVKSYRPLLDGAVHEQVPARQDLKNGYAQPADMSIRGIVVALHRKF